MLALLVQDPHNPRCLVVDAVACFTHQDISVMSMVGELHKELKRRGIHMVMAGRHGQMSQWFKQAGIRVGEDGIILCPDMYQALRMTRCYREPVFRDDEGWRAPRMPCSPAGRTMTTCPTRRASPAPASRRPAPRRSERHPLVAGPSSCDQDCTPPRLVLNALQLALTRAIASTWISHADSIPRGPGLPLRPDLATVHRSGPSLSDRGPQHLHGGPRLLSGVAALAVGNQVFDLAITLFSFVSIGTSVVITQYLGAGDKEKARVVIHTAIGFNLLVGLVAAVGVMAGPAPCWR